LQNQQGQTALGVTCSQNRKIFLKLGQSDEKTQIHWSNVIFLYFYFVLYLNRNKPDPPGRAT
jgi:hypothetical protein